VALAHPSPKRGFWRSRQANIHDNQQNQRWKKLGDAKSPRSSVKPSLGDSYRNRWSSSDELRGLNADRWIEPGKSD
jgi:hypothetical protein